MIYDLMPHWLRWLLDMQRATLPTDEWTWRHTCRFGRDPGKLADDYARWLARGGGPRPTPWLLRGDNAVNLLVVLIIVALVLINR